MHLNKNCFNHLLKLYTTLFVIGLLSLFFINKGDIVLFINQYHSNFSDASFKQITNLGNGILLLPLLLLTLLLKDRFSALVVVLASVIHGIAVLVLKRVLFESASRPIAFFSNTSLLHFVDGVQVHASRSFPSGHTTTAFVIAFCLSLLFQKRLLTYVFLFVALIVAYSRVYLLQHFYIDILFGALVGTASVIISRLIAIQVFQKRYSKTLIPSSKLYISANNLADTRHTIQQIQYSDNIMKISIVVTLLNEEDNIFPLVNNVQKAMNGIDYELILVDDGSTDSTVSRIKSLENSRIKLLIFYKNYGQTSAMSAGIEAASGDYIVTMDGDLQNDPSDIPLMLEKLLREEWDVVAGRRLNRKDGMFVRKIPSKIANSLIRKLTDIRINDYGCTLKIFKKEIAKDLGLYGELHRFIPVLAHLQGARIAEMNVKHHPRIHGSSKYGLGRTFKVMSDLMLMVFMKKYLQKPIHLLGPIGFLSFSVGSIINLYLLIAKIAGQDIWGRPLLILGITLLLAGIQFITFGFIMEMNMRTYYESSDKKTYRIREVFIGKENNLSTSKVL
ncbi:glycosyltransferase [Chondrinema litorale]|uniref:glycosyltransferase n=1 Tax=Chondrinema litorale TaxID=2994555 RepID=UPI0032B352A4